MLASFIRNQKPLASHCHRPARTFAWRRMGKPRSSAGSSRRAWTCCSPPTPTTSPSTLSSWLARMTSRRQHRRRRSH
eukprot:7992310-Alexandrium_andersonii.AAC.1